MFPPQELLYSHRHLWVRHDPEKMQAWIGITDFLQEHLPEVESLDIPLEGDELEMDVPCVFLHLSTKRIRKLYSPLSGRVLEINRDVLDNQAMR
jgi:glycine cleavage system H protein